MPDAATIGAGVAAFLFGAWGTVQTWRVGKAKEDATAAKGVSTDDLARSNADLAEAYKLKASEWKAAFETEHAESVAYHKYVHDKAEVDNATKLKLTEENALLRARTDLTPIIDHMEIQSKTNERVAVTLENLAKTISALMGRIGIAEAIDTKPIEKP